MSAPVPGEPSEQVFSEAAREAAAHAMVCSAARWDTSFRYPAAVEAVCAKTLAAAVDADPRLAAFLKLAALSDEELVERIATALAPNHRALGPAEEQDYYAARKVLAALGLPVAEQETTG